MKSIISTSSAPAAIGPYSQAVRTGKLCFLSGMLGVDPATGALSGATAAAQAAQSLENIRALLESQGLSLSQVVKTTVFLTDLSAFSEVNAVYAGFFPENAPARSCVEVSRLPKDALVEIEAIVSED